MQITMSFVLLSQIISKEQSQEGIYWLDAEQISKAHQKASKCNTLWLTRLENVTIDS